MLEAPKVQNIQITLDHICDIPTQKIEVVISQTYGGFGLSDRAQKLYCEKKNMPLEDYDDYNVVRHDPALVEVVRELGEEADTTFSELVVVELESPLYMIDEYDGYESVYTPFGLSWTICDTDDVKEKFPHFFL
jgi:hypothetical protein